MAKVLVSESHLINIAGAIRTKNGTQNSYTPAEMASAISSISAGYPEPSGTVNIIQNGTTNVKDYASANVNVPNSYSAGDEGKVVSNGTLVSQGNQTITQNGTYDTTLVSELIANIEGSGGSGGGASITTSTDSPTSSQGIDGDIWIHYFDFENIPAGERTYKLTIREALRGNSSLTYAGATELDIVFDDGNGNEVLLSSLGLTADGTSSSNVFKAFDGNTGTYWEANPTPIWISMKGVVPAEYSFKKLKVMQRSDSYSSDVWKTFSLEEMVGQGSRVVIEEKNMTTANWAGARNYTYFSKNIDDEDSLSVLGVYAKINGAWKKIDALTVDVIRNTDFLFSKNSFQIVPKYAEDMKRGYISNGGWNYSSSDPTLVDVWEVEAGHKYIIISDEVYGNRCRAMFTTTDITSITSNVTGTKIGNESNTPSSFMVTGVAMTYGGNILPFEPSDDGYIAVSKTNENVQGIPCHLVDISEVVSTYYVQIGGNTTSEGTDTI